LIRIRKIAVTEGAKLILFSTFSAARIPGTRVPIEIMGYLLNRNTSLATCAWQASVSDHDGIASFALAYCALTEGLDAGALKSLCEVMVREVQEFDGKMREAGLV
jgi:hypothetical protein